MPDQILRPTAASEAFPVQLPARESLPRGEIVAIRRLRAGEQHLFADHLLRLDAESRRLRFGNAVNEDFLRSYAEMALGDDALVKGCFIDGVLRGVAELRFLTGNHEDAEGAFSLERAFQSRGLGDRLFERLVVAARNRGVRRIFLTCLRENRRMQKIAGHHGAELSFTAGDVMAEIRRPYADAGSIAREWMEEGEAFVFGVLEARRRGFSSFMQALLPAFGPFSPKPTI